MINLLKQRLVPLFCAVIQPPFWHKLLTIDLVIPHWHIISDHVQPHISGLYKYRNVKQFKDDIDYFLKFYKPVSLADIISYLDGGMRLPQRCFLPTFDDGFREIHEIVAPILYSKGIPGAFFLTTATIDNQTLCYPQKKSLIINLIKDIKSWVIEKEIIQVLDNSGIPGDNLLSRIQNIYYLKRHILDHVGIILNCDFGKYVHNVQPYLTSGQIKNLIKNGFAIGAHSVDHPLYSELSLEEQLSQTLESIRQLSKTFQYTCNAFAFPYSDADISEEFFQKAFADTQLKVSFGIGGTLISISRRHLPRFSMERTDLPAKHILARQFGRTFASQLFR